MVQLVALGEVDEGVLEELSRGLAEAAGFEVEPGEAAALVPSDRDVRGDKYRSSLVLHHLPNAPAEGHLLAVTAADIHGGGLHFVFGHADPASRRAVVSFARLTVAGNQASGGVELGRRLLVESLHELGHLRGLAHCDQPSCPMNPFYTLYELDQRTPKYCPRCRQLANEMRPGRP